MLLEAVKKVRQNKGAAGVDGVTTGDIEKTPGGTIQWVRELSEELRAKK